MVNDVLVVGLVFSIFFNLFVIGFLLFTRIGKAMFLRWKQRFLYKKGHYVNTIFINKNGVGRELFEKVDEDTGVFKVDSDKYVRVPQLKFEYNGIPTFIHYEKQPEPVNFLHLSEGISSPELDIIMTAGATFDFKEWFEKNKKFIMLGGLIVIGLLAAGLYFTYMNYQFVQDGGVKVVKHAASAVINATGV